MNHFLAIQFHASVSSFQSNNWLRKSRKLHRRNPGLSTAPSQPSVITAVLCLDGLSTAKALNTPSRSRHPVGGQVRLLVSVCAQPG